MEEFKVYNLDDKSKKALSDLAQRTFDSFLKQGLIISGFSDNILNLKFNALSSNQREQIVDGLLELLKGRNNFSEEETGYLKDRLEFLSYGKTVEV